MLRGPGRAVAAAVATAVLLVSGCSTDRTRAPDVHLALAGDALVHTGVWETAERDGTAAGEDRPDFGPMLAGVKPLVEPADLAISHLETPVSPDGGPYRNYPRFAAPPQVIDGLQGIGFDAFTTASNHSVDFGFDGLVRTFRALDARGAAHTGTFATERSAEKPVIMDAGPARVGLISMTYGTNDLPVTEPWSVNRIDVPRAIAQAREMHEQGADVVLVAVHAGDEYSHSPSALQRRVFDELTRSPYVDLVYGHHAHAVQPFDRVNGKWVLYGLGNLVARQSANRPRTYQGIIAGLTLRKADGRWRVIRPAYAPTMITDDSLGPDTRVMDPVAVLDDPASTTALRVKARKAIRDVDAVMARDGVTTNH